MSSSLLALLLASRPLVNDIFLLSKLCSISRLSSHLRLFTYSKHSFVWTGLLLLCKRLLFLISFLSFKLQLFSDRLLSGRISFLGCVLPNKAPDNFLLLSGCTYCKSSNEETRYELLICFWELRASHIFSDLLILPLSAFDCGFILLSASTFSFK